MKNNKMQHNAHLEAQSDKTSFGFWLYLMTDCVLFASLFATYLVLHNNTNGGPSASELFSMPFILVETVILLVSSFVAGLAILAARNKDTTKTIALLAVTGVLGVAFVGMELYEFNHLYQEGHSWQASAFLSAFFTLVGTHGLHITVGLIWLAVLIYLITKRGLTDHVVRKLTLFGIFWHFLDIVWIFIFTIVYMFGASSL